MKLEIVVGEKRSRNKDFAAKLEPYSDEEWDLINVFPNPVNGILTAVLKPRTNVNTKPVENSKPATPVDEKKPKKSKE